MSESGELLEQMEHAGHAGGEHAHGEGRALAKHIGITMALLGVLLAICSALVASTRTDQIVTMVQQAAASIKAQSVSTKYRSEMSHLQALHAAMPNEKEFKATEAELQKLNEQMGATEAAHLLRGVRLEGSEILNTVTPTKEDVLRFARIVRKLEQKREAAQEWAESFEPSVEVHAEATEHYEWGQLAAEIGIIMASIALLLGSRKAWLTSVAIGLLSIGILSWTGAVTHRHLRAVQQKIIDVHAQYHSLDIEASERADDEKLLEEIEKQ
jgi:hypothetical protein